MSLSAGKEAPLADRLLNHVTTLAGRIGERHYWSFDALEASADYIVRTLRALGTHVERQEFTVGGKTVANIEATIEGKIWPHEIVVVGAHYDTVPGSPGADDNASGVAGILELARMLGDQSTARTIRLVAFVNEEPPFFRTDEMGSVVYARQCRSRNENIAAMLSLEMIGYYVHSDDSQHYPFPFRFFYPAKGNFIGFVGNVASRSLVRTCVRAFRRHSDFPAESLAAPGWIVGLGWSDHWAFWREGYAAVMVTDTSFFRYPYYHASSDLPEHLHYEAMARVVEGIGKVVADVASE